MLAVVALLIAPGVLRAQDPGSLPQRPLPPGTTISARVDADTIIIGDRFRYEVTIDGSLTVQQIGTPSFASTGALELVNGPNRSTSMTIINGRSQQRVSFFYDLQARQIGEFTIPPARVRINNQWYETEAITITIQDVPDIGGDVAGYISARTNDPKINQQLKDRYFATMEAPTEVYIRQAIPVRTYVYRDPNLPEFIQAELARGVGGQDFIIPDAVNQQAANPRIRWESVTLGNRQMLRAHLFTAWVIPTRTGELILDPPTVRAYLPTRPRYGNDPFANFFGNNQVVAEMPVRAASVTVKSLPDPPADTVAQVVGDNLSIELKADRDKLLRRELLTVTASIVGEGFFDLLSQPPLPEINNITRIDTSTSSRSGVASGKLASEKIFEYVYQAVEPGDIQIPPIRFAVFSPETGEQTVIETAALSVKILPDNASSIQIGGTSVSANGGTGNGDRTSPRAQAREIGRDVAFIDTTPLTMAATAPGAPFYTRPWFWLAQLFPIIVSIGYGIVVLRARRTSGESAATRSKRGRKAAENALREARQQVDATDKALFYTTLSSGLMGYVGSLVGRSSKGLTIEEAATELARRGVPNDTIAPLQAVLQTCDAMKYSPTADNAADRQRLLSQSEAAIAELDKVRK